MRTFLLSIFSSRTTFRVTVSSASACGKIAKYQSISIFHLLHIPSIRSIRSSASVVRREFISVRRYISTDYVMNNNNLNFNFKFYTFRWFSINFRLFMDNNNNHNIITIIIWCIFGYLFTRRRRLYQRRTFEILRYVMYCSFSQRKRLVDDSARRCELTKTMSTMTTLTTLATTMTTILCNHTETVINKKNFSCSIFPIWATISYRQWKEGINKYYIIW